MASTTTPPYAVHAAHPAGGTAALAASDALTPESGVAPKGIRGATTEPAWVRRLLIGLALAFMTLFLFVPLATVFIEAFKKGVDVYLASITDPDALDAIKLTLIATGISVPLNLVLGVAAAGAWPSSTFAART
jgi:sulfate transport system permease protein